MAIFNSYVSLPEGKGCPGVQCTPYGDVKTAKRVSQPRLVSKSRPETEANCWNQTPGSMQVLEMCIFFCIPYMIYIYIMYIYIYTYIHRNILCLSCPSIVNTSILQYQSLQRKLSLTKIDRHADRQKNK